MILTGFSQTGLIPHTKAAVKFPDEIKFRKMSSAAIFSIILSENVLTIGSFDGILSKCR